MKKQKGHATAQPLLAILNGMQAHRGKMKYIMFIENRIKETKTQNS